MPSNLFAKEDEIIASATERSSHGFAFNQTMARQNMIQFIVACLSSQSLEVPLNVVGIMFSVSTSNLHFHVGPLVSCLSPVVYLLLSIFIFHCSISNESKTLRAFLLPFFLGFAILSFTTSSHFFVISTNLASLWAHSITLYIAHIISLLFLEKVGESQPVSLTSRASLATTLSLWGNPRLISIKKPENGPMGKNGKDERAKVKAQELFSTFVLLRLAKITLYYYFHTRLFPALFAQIIGQLGIEDVFPAMTPGLLSPGYINARAALVRSHAALVWIWESLVFIDGTNSILAIVSVVTGLSRPHDWPHLFGNPLDACGLRAFWSRFWHHLARRPHRNFGRFVAQRMCLMLPAGVGRGMEGAVVAFVVFFLSGVSHAAVSWRLGHPGWLWVDTQWFMLNFLGCSLETLVTSAARRLAVRADWERELAALEGSWLGWLVGYTWTFAFFFWSVPMFSFSRVYAQLVEEQRWMTLLRNARIGPQSV